MNQRDMKPGNEAGDIVERLRASCDVREAAALREVAADAIERLRAAYATLDAKCGAVMDENARLRTDLDKAEAGAGFNAEEFIEVTRLRAERDALRAENTKLHGWVETEAQRAGTLQRRVNALETECDALPEWPEFPPVAGVAGSNAEFRALSLHTGVTLVAALARLALAREWIGKQPHGCLCREQIGEPCDCGRDALLAKLEGPGP